MEDYRRSPETPRVSGLPDAGQVLDAASAFLRQLIAFPDSQSVGPLSLLPMPAQGSVGQPNTSTAQPPPSANRRHRSWRRRRRCSTKRWREACSRLAAVP